MTGRIAAVAGLLALVATADDRKFTFVQEPVVPHAGETEFEQWITGRFGHEEGNYARWDLREELEYGLTDQLAGALYLNFTDIHEGIEGGEDAFESGPPLLRRSIGDRGAETFERTRHHTG